MEKSTKDTEIEKLQKRVEKLVKANKSLKKDKRNLKRRLTTSQNKSNKYRSELKKKEKPNVVSIRNRVPFSRVSVMP